MMVRDEFHRASHFPTVRFVMEIGFSLNKVIFLSMEAFVHWMMERENEETVLFQDSGNLLEQGRDIFQVMNDQGTGDNVEGIGCEMGFDGITR